MERYNIYNAIKNERNILQDKLDPSNRTPFIYIL